MDSAVIRVSTGASFAVRTDWYAQRRPRHPSNVLARAVMEKGMAGVMIAPIPSLRTDDQITEYYRQRSRRSGRTSPS